MASNAINTHHFFIHFFAMLVTLLSFILLSLQIFFISLVWMFSHFFSLIHEIYNDNKSYKKSYK